MVLQHFTPPPHCWGHRSSSQLLRSVAAVTLAICLSAFAASPAWSFKAGAGADDTALIRTYANVAEYLEDEQRNEQPLVSIGGNLYNVWELEDINDESGLTDSNLPNPTTTGHHTTAVGDSARATGHRSTALGEDSEASGYRATAIGQSSQATFKGATAIGHNARALANDATALGENSEASGDDATAIGQNSRATFNDATAIGHNAHALAQSATAVGENAGAYSNDAIALGDNARAYSADSVALGQYSFAQGDSSTLVGNNSVIVGQRSSALGRSAKSIGERNTVLGRSARAANISLDPSAENSLSEGEYFGSLANCAYERNLWIPGFITDCAPSLLPSESSDPRLSADTQAGAMFREQIQQRLRDRVDTFAVDRATAVGESATVYGNWGTAIGQYSSASHASLGVGAGSVSSGQRSTAVGTWAHITGDHSVGLGGYAQAHGSEGTAIGRHSGAGSWTVWSHYDNAADFVSNHEDEFTDTFVVIAGNIYSVRDLKATSGLTDANLPAPVSTDISKVIASRGVYEKVEYYVEDSSSSQYSHVIIGGRLYLKSDLDAIPDLTYNTLPEPVTGADGAVAVGHAAQAVEEDSIALGRRALATGSQGIAIGFEVEAGENDVVIGTADHEYFLPGLSASQTASDETVTVDANGQLTGDGGALHARLGAPSDTASATGSAYARIASLRQLVDSMGDDPSGSDIATLRQAVRDVEASIGAPADQADATGTAFARIADVQDGLQTVEDSLGGASDAADAAGSAFARISQLQEGLGTTSDAASATGSAYARIANAQDGLQSVETSLGSSSDSDDAAGSAFARISHLSTQLGATTDSGDTEGSAFAQINQLQADLGTSSDEASRTGNAYERIRHVQDAIDTATSDDEALIKAIADTTALTQETRSLLDSSITDAMQIEASVEKRLADIQTNARNQVLRIIHRDSETGDRTVVALRGPTNEQIQTLVSLITSGAAPDAVIRGADGNPIGTTAKEFRALDDPNSMGEASEPEPIPIGSNNRLGYLFEALYGDPTDGIVYGSATDSDTPHEKSAFGRINALEKGSLADPYRAAPAVGSGMNAPQSADKRRIVVQDENADGSIRLSTISFSDITAVDRRVEELDGRLDKATAMSSALTGLPNMVPGSGQYFAGVGLGSYGGESAVAIGGAARVRDNLFINVGASTSSSGGGQAIRAGAGFVW